VVVRDQSSATGTFLNNRLVTRREARHGDRLRIGTYTFEVDIERSSPRSIYQLDLGETTNGWPGESLEDEAEFELPYSDYSEDIAEDLDLNRFKRSLGSARPAEFNSEGGLRWASGLDRETRRREERLRQRQVAEIVTAAVALLACCILLFSARVPSWSSLTMAVAVLIYCVGRFSWWLVQSASRWNQMSHGRHG
jgi:hypothetical protein